MTLARYRKKRNFARTPEPPGKGQARAGSRYLIQKHAASHLHYDFRLQIGDTLKSWAVPKGPSLDPSIKRLAMHVEDHPLEYGSFEGTIPAGEYGGGTVMLWDRGTWSMDEDPERAYRAGKLHFTLHGEKLRGEWVLVRRGGSAHAEPGKDPWFLFKVRDAYADAKTDILTAAPLSVKTGRDLDEIAAGGKSWKSNRKVPRATRSGTTKAAGATAARANQVNPPTAAPSARLPAKIIPQLATLASTPPEGDQWLNEIKFDGYRMICRVNQGQAQFLSRNQLDWTARMPSLVKAVAGLGLDTAILDGEVVAPLADGTTSFQELQNAFSSERKVQLIYYVFDLLYLNGKSLAKLPLEDRKATLAQLLGQANGAVRYSEHLEGHAAEFFAAAAQKHLEGIICKRRDRPYRPGRSTEWLKVKCGHREEFVIGGFTPPAGSRQGFGALLVGYHDDEGQLVYTGRVGTGFNDQLLNELSRRLKAIEQKASPFVNLQGRTGQARGVHWVNPTLVAQVRFGEWTHEGMLRHPAFQGLREDKKASEITRERPLPVGKSEIAKMKPAKKSKSSPQADAALPDSVRLTHPERVLFPEDQISKADLASYYVRVAPWMLPQLIDRPLVLVRCPDGIAGQCFFQKHPVKGMPDVLRQVSIAEKSKKEAYLVVDNLEGLLALVQFNAIEIHHWGCRADEVDRPDRLVIDLDPDPSVAWHRVVESARQIREFLSALDLASFVKTTGGKGLHLVVPIQRRTPWDDAKEFCHTLANTIVRADPERYTSNLSKAARRGKIFIDYLRNARGASFVAAYSTRARSGAPVATPVTWEELLKLSGPQQFTLENVPARLARLKRDPWHDLADVKQSLTKSLLRKLGTMR